MVQGRAHISDFLFQLLQIRGSLLGPGPDPGQLLVGGSLAAGKAFHLALLLIQPLLQLVPAAYEMLCPAPGGRDLLPADPDIRLQGASYDIRVGDPVPGLFYLLFQMVQFFLGGLAGLPGLPVLLSGG